MLHHRCLTVLNMSLGGNPHGPTYKSENAVFISEIWKMSVSMSTKLAFDSCSPTYIKYFCRTKINMDHFYGSKKSFHVLSVAVV